MFEKERVEEAKKYLDCAIKENKLPGCSVLIKDNDKETLYLEAGFSDIEKQIPFKRDAICHLFSVSKVFTTVAVHKAIELHLLHKEDLVSDYLPPFKKAKVLTEDGSLKEVPSPTIDDLLNMCAGLGYSEGENGQVFQKVSESNFTTSTKDFTDDIAKNPLSYVPRTKRAYSVGADLLGAIVEIVSKMSFGKFMREYIFEPAGLKNTGFFLNDSQREKLIPCYRFESNKFVKMEKLNLGMDIDARKNLFESGGAGLLSTIDDVSNFGVALLEGKILKKETLESLYKEEESDARFPFDWMAPEGMVYKNLLKICRTKKEPEDIPGDFGWNGWLGCHIAINPRIHRVYTFFTQVADYGEGEVNKEFRRILYRE